MIRKLVIIVVALILVAGAAYYGINLWRQGSQYISTDNAVISAPLISVSSLSPGQIIKVNVGIGDRVGARQEVAEVGTPRFADNLTRQGFQATPGTGAPVECPVAGYVAAVWTYPGAIIGSGSPIITLFDDSKIWVTANINENKIQDVHPGQGVEVTVDCLGGKVIRGKVQGIAPATAGSFSLLPAGNTSASFTKVSQVIPVRINLDNTADLSLIPGSSVEVKINTR